MWGMLGGEGDVDCSVGRNCGQCSELTGCVWCMGSGLCVRGSAFGPTQPGLISSCGEFRWRQVSGRCVEGEREREREREGLTKKHVVKCAVNGLYALAGTGGTVMAIVVLVGLYIAYVRWRSRRKRLNKLCVSASLRRRMRESHPTTSYRRWNMDDSLAEERESLTSAHPKSDQRRAAMREKYGTAIREPEW